MTPGDYAERCYGERIERIEYVIREAIREAYEDAAKIVEGEWDTEGRPVGEFLAALIRSRSQGETDR
jgi:hypothetical protein